MSTPASISHPSGLSRWLFAVAAVLAGLALAIKAIEWARQGRVDWGMALSLAGLLVITATGALNVPRGKVRMALSVLGVASVLAGAFLTFAP